MVAAALWYKEAARSWQRADQSDTLLHTGTNSMNRLLIIPLICVPSFWAEPCDAGVTRDVSKILVGLALVYTAYICFPKHAQRLQILL